LLRTINSDSDFLKKNPFLSKIEDSLNNYFRVEGYICLKDMGVMDTPEHVPDVIANAFREGAISVVTDCPNAAVRLVIDLTTRPMLPAEERPGLNQKVLRELGLRLPWQFQNRLLPKELEDLSHCIREDGNDGAHAGTLTNNDALDLQDFCVALLERIFTEPAPRCRTSGSASGVPIDLTAGLDETRSLNTAAVKAAVSFWSAFPSFRLGRVPL
jgi:hypothetical protein